MPQKGVKPSGNATQVGANIEILKVTEEEKKEDKSKEEHKPHPIYMYNIYTKTD